MNKNILQFAMQFRNNPMGMLASRFNIPSNINSPQDIIQHLLNSGQVTQEQVNKAMSMRNDPTIQMIFGGMK